MLIFVENLLFVAGRLYRLFLGFLFLSGLFFTCLMVRLTLPYLSFRYDVDFLLTKQSVLHITAWRYAFYVHITSSLLVLPAGLMQFLPFVLTRLPRLHRLLGRLYVLSILLLSAPSGFVMALYANGGVWAKLSFLLTSLLWACFTWLAYRRVRRRDLEGHVAFMYRSFALTLSAVTLRSYVFLLPLLAHVHHLHGREMYVWVSWLSWVPNLLVAEWLLWRRRMKKAAAESTAAALDAVKV